MSERAKGATVAGHRVRAVLAIVLAGLLGLTTGCASTGAGPDPAAAHAVVSLDSALHDQLPAAVRDRGSLRIGTDASYAPASFFAADGRTIQGFEPDLAAAIGEVLGVRIEFVVTDFDAILPRLREHEIDLAMAAITDTADRERDADFITYFTAGTSIVVQRGNPHGIIDLRDLCGTTVAVEEATVQVDLLARTQQGCDRDPIVVKAFDTNADALLQLRTGRVVAVLNDYPPAAYLATDERTRGHYQLASDVQYEPGFYGIGVATDAPQLRDAVRAALDQVVRSGAYTEVLTRWGVEHGAVAQTSINSASHPGA